MTKFKTSSILRHAGRLLGNSRTARMAVVLATACAVALSASTATAQVLTVGKTRLTVANAPTWVKTPGKVIMEAILTDGDSQSFVSDILANTATVTITDSGSYALTALALDGCVARKGGVKCISNSTGFRLKFIGIQHRNFPDVYRIKLKIRDLTDAETGTGPLVAPIFITLDQSPMLSRSDEQPTSECSERAAGNALRCKADN
jgi:hypothetical protein